jgi:hypothetical protein
VPNTQKKFRLLLKLKAFGEGRVYVMLDQRTPIDVRKMRSAWPVTPQTADKNMSTVKAFSSIVLPTSGFLETQYGS